MSWWEGTRTYTKWEALEMPIQHGSTVIEHFSVKCNRCGEPAKRLRGKARFYAHCIMVQCGGVCDACHLVIYAQMRLYSDGRVLWEGRRGWQSLSMRTRWAQTCLHVVSKWLKERLGEVHG